MQELKVPLAITEEGHLVAPVEAERGRTYCCPGCAGVVIFRKGEKVVAHFAHSVGTTCSQETILHKTAKELIKKTVLDWQAGKSTSPVLVRVCAVCRATSEQSLPNKVESAEVEVRVASGHVVDVALFVNGEPQAAVEVRVTHAVDAIKAQEIAIPFIELDGQAVIDNPKVWKPVQDGFKPFVCKQCRDGLSLLLSKAESIAKKTDIQLPKEYYRFSFCDCWKCGEEILVFAWPGKDLHHSVPSEQYQKPKTIQLRYSKMAGTKYLANTCPYCNSIQGDFFLFFEPEGPFFGIDIHADNPTDFQRDMLQIAAHLDYLGQLRNQHQ